MKQTYTVAVRPPAKEVMSMEISEVILIILYVVCENTQLLWSMFDSLKRK